MDATDLSLSLSLCNWPEQGPEETAVSTLISRIQQQRGHFKDLNEALLESEIADQLQNGDQMDIDDGSDGDDAAEKPATPAGEDAIEALQKTRAEMLEALGHAHNEALLALDYISLVTSLNAPEAGLSTMSPALKAAVPPGCLGFDRISRKIDKKAQEEDMKVAKKWKVDGLNSAADALLGASKKLGAEVQKETVYWQGALAIRNDGWLITRMPRERNVLAVRYGFAEAAKEYKDKGIGALRRNDDGSVRMDDIDTGSRGRVMLRVQVVRNGEVIGVSTQRAGKNDGSVKDMIRRARNFIYEDELFFEIMKEARNFAGHMMRTSEESAMIELGSGKMIVLDMAPLDDDTTPDPPLSNSANSLAQSIALALRILLSYNHRLSLKARSKPPPPLSNRKPSRAPLQLLRPVTTHLYHRQHQQHLIRTLSKLRSFARTAGLAPASYTMSPLSNTLDSELKGVDSVVETFLHLLASEATVNLPGGWVLSITMRTRLQHPVWGTQYVITTSHDGVAARLMGENRFSTAEEMASYLYWCLERSVVNWVRLLSEGQDKDKRWEQVAQGNEMVCAKRGSRVRVEVDSVGLAVTCGSTGGRDEKAVWDGSDTGRTLAELLAHIVA